MESHKGLHSVWLECLLLLAWSNMALLLNLLLTHKTFLRSKSSAQQRKQGGRTANSSYQGCLVAVLELETGTIKHFRAEMIVGL